MAVKTPTIDTELLKYLDSVFPERGYHEGDTLEVLARISGCRAVYLHLKSVYNEQQAAITGSTE